MGYCLDIKVRSFQTEIILGDSLFSHGEEPSPISTSVQRAVDSTTTCWRSVNRRYAIVVVDLERGEHRGTILGLVCDIEVPGRRVQC